MNNFFRTFLVDNQMFMDWTPYQPLYMIIFTYLEIQAHKAESGLLCSTNGKRSVQVFWKAQAINILTYQ